MLRLLVKSNLFHKNRHFCQIGQSCFSANTFILPHSFYSFYNLIVEISYLEIKILLLTKVAIDVSICTRGAMTIFKDMKVCYWSKYTFLKLNYFFILKKSKVFFTIIFKTLSILSNFVLWPMTFNFSQI